MTALALAAALIAAVPPASFTEKACADERVGKIARCGTVIVPEDRQREQSRTIALNVIVLPATSPGPHAPPLFDIDGGPGLPVTKNAAFYASDGQAYRARRDIVLVDQRGTGGSNLLACPEFAKPENAYQPLYPPAGVRDCRKSLEGRADLTKYGTDDAVADLDEVRAALGHEKIDIFGLSYGTTVALRYLATHPHRVRAAVLMGVAPASTRPPKLHAVAGERAMMKLFELCDAEPACNAAFDSSADLVRARARLPQIKGAPSEEIFFEKLRSLMYQPTGARRVPFILHRAAAGDLAPFFEATKPSGPDFYAHGMFLSVVCSEGMALMDVEAASREARSTIFNDYRLRRQKEACAEWPTAAVAADYLQPVRSDVPVLLISGELDPVTPPSLADEAASSLTRSRHLVIPGSGHIFDGMSGIDTCLDPLIVKFLDTGDIESMSADCVDAMNPPPFVTSKSPGK